MNRLMTLNRLVLTGLLTLGAGAASASQTGDWRAQATEARDRAAKLRGAAARCRQRVASGELEGCTVQVTFRGGQEVSIGEAEALADELLREADRRCDAIRQQRDRDLQAIEHQRRAIEQCNEDLADWTRDSQEAQASAVLDGINLLTNGMLGSMAESDAAVKKVRRALDRYENQLARQRKKIDSFQLAKLSDLARRQLELEASMAAGKALQKAKGRAELVWGEFTSTTRRADIAHTTLMEVLGDVADEPLFKELLTKEALLPLVQRLKTKALFPNKPYVIQLVQFAVDYGYDAAKWLSARAQILRRHDLAEDDLRGVGALKQQLERTEADLRSCR